MALGPGWFEKKYENMNLEELTKELEKEKELYNSGEILKEEEERIKKGIDDNSPLSDYETKVSVLEELIKEKNNSDKILKINCRSCGNQLDIDCAKFPKNIKTLDTKCNVCGTMIKFGNLNYIDEYNAMDNEVISVLAIERIGIPTKQFENTILFVSKENAVVNNKKVLINDKKFNFIIKILEQKLSNIKEIRNQQTSGFLKNHVSYDNQSKIFNVKYNNEEISINYHTGTESDKYITSLIDSIISILNEENKEIENDDINKKLKSDNIERDINSACKLYKETGNISDIVSTIEKIINVNALNNIHVFWVDVSRYVLVYLILKEYNDDNECSYSKLIQILNNKELFVKKCKEANNIKDENVNLKEYATKIVNSSEKMIDSYYEIICFCLNIKVETSKNNFELQKLIEDIITDEDVYLKDTILNIVELIVDLHSETTTTIAELIKYEPNKSFVEPFVQGKVFNYIFDVCKKMNINLEDTNDSFGGLAYYYTFKKNAKKENNNDELIEHIVNSKFNFKFKLPKVYGEITKKSDISFRIGNSINLMISKCLDSSKLNERSAQWLENSAKTNNQNILKEKERHYLLNNNTIEVIEKLVEKDNQRRIYKFVYFNESMIIFGFSFNLYNEKFENIINNAIISITETSNQKMIERDPFENPNKNEQKHFVKYCPYCKEHLQFLMPGGDFLYCDKCDRYFKNENGNVGDETTNPYIETDVLY